MHTFRLGFLFVYFLVFLRLNAALSLDKTKSAVTPQQLVHTQVKVQTTEHHRSDLDEYEDYEDDFSGDHEYPRVEFSAKPRNFIGITEADRTTNRRRTGGNRKKNPCLKKKNEDYCIHGVCQYLRDIKRTTCRCNNGYIGERCQFLSLPVGTLKDEFNHKTTLAVTAAVLTVLSLTIIGTLLILRYYKRRRNDETDEKTRLSSVQ